MIKVGIIGASGYAGAEILRLLQTHPEAEITAISSESFKDQPISDVYPSFAGICDKLLCDKDKVFDNCDVIFASLPHGLSEGIAAKCAEKNITMIDMGADFRLENEADYTKWYGGTYENKQLHESAVYGLPELFRDKISAAAKNGAVLIANPGCYPTSVALGLSPLLSAGIADVSVKIVIDSKSGTTGAGRGLTQNTHYAECNESFAPYKVAAHRHTPEIEQTLTKAAGKGVKVTFVPHLLPINRGIISTMYVERASDMPLPEIHKLYVEAYKDEQFVRVLPLGKAANLKNVRMSNYCDISLHEDEHTGTIVIVSAIDNMVKGAAGQAIQNMNIIFGLAENTGLNFVPPAF